MWGRHCGKAPWALCTFRRDAQPGHGSLGPSVRARPGVGKAVRVEESIRPGLGGSLDPCLVSVDWRSCSVTFEFEPAGPLWRTMLHARYEPWSQHDVVQGRHLDRGSSACCLFAACLGSSWLTADVAITPDKLRQLLSKCVVAWDQLGGDGSGALTDDAIRLVELDTGHRFSRTVGQWTTHEQFVELLRSAPLPAFCMITAASPGELSGKTFVALLKPGEIQIVDSHPHVTAEGPKGLVWAKAAGHDAVAAVAGWVWRPDGLLSQLGCCRDMVEVTVVSDTADVLGSDVEDSPGPVPPVPPPPAPTASINTTCRAPKNRAECGHSVFSFKCDRCRWHKHKTAWLEKTRYLDKTSHKPHSWLAEAPPTETWGLGCQLCARFLAEGHTAGTQSRASNWAAFEIRQSGVCKDSFLKHARAELHVAAMEAYAACDLPPTVAPTRRVADDGDSAGRVPRCSRFLDALRIAQQGRGGRAFCSMPASVPDGSMPLVSTGVFRDGSRAAWRKMVTCGAAVLDELDQDLLRKAVRIAFAEDDRNQVRILRVRVVWQNPTVGAKEFFGGCLQDPGFDATEYQKATLLGLQRLAWVRRGSQQKSSAGAAGAAADDLPTGTGDLPSGTYLDQDLWRHIRQCVFSGATDGAAVAMKSITQLRTDGDLPGLRYQFRDRPHTTRTCVKLTFGLCSESQEIRRLLITGKSSFARRARNSARFRSIWLWSQKEEADRFWDILKDLSYAEHRYDSRSKPMQIFMIKLGPAVQVLRALAEDPKQCHKDDRMWATGMLQSLSGEAGLARLLLFAVDTDFAVATHRLVRLQDAQEPDVALSGEQCLDCLDTCRVLFQDGRIFDRTPNGTYTSHLIHGLKAVPLESFTLPDGTSVRFGWPSDDKDVLEKAVVHARKLFQTVSLFFDLNFPDYAWRSKFTAFSCTSTLPQSTKEEHIRALAKKEGLSESRAAAQFREATVHVIRLQSHLGDGRAAWAAYLDKYCRDPRKPRQWRAHADAIGPLVLTYLGIMDGSSDIERNFSQLALLEGSVAVGHHTRQHLQDLLKLRLGLPPAFFDQYMSMTHVPAQGELGKHLSCERFLSQCQDKFSMFFGRWALPSRSMTPVMPDRHAELLALRRPRWQHNRPHYNRRGLRLRTSFWNDSVKELRTTASEGAVIDLSKCPEPDMSHATCFMRKRTAEEAGLHEMHEREHGLAAPPRTVQLRSLLPKASNKAQAKAKGQLKAKRMGQVKSKAKGQVKPKAQAKKAKGPKPTALAKALVEGPAKATLDDVIVPDGQSLFFYPCAAKKHARTFLDLSRRGLIANRPASATQHIASKGDRDVAPCAAISLAAFLSMLHRRVPT